MLDLWATGQALKRESQALHKTKRLQMSTGLHREVQSTRSVIDRTLLFDPWRLPKRKANRAFPFSLHTGWESESTSVCFLGLR